MVMVQSCAKPRQNQDVPRLAAGNSRDLLVFINHKVDAVGPEIHRHRLVRPDHTHLAHQQNALKRRGGLPDQCRIVCGITCVIGGFGRGRGQLGGTATGKRNQGYQLFHSSIVAALGLMASHRLKFARVCLIVNTKDKGRV
jgi:hypothetical protein